MGKRTEHFWLAILMLLTLAHGLAYALLVPLWQVPDEPMLYEYTALTARLGRIPTLADRDLELESQLFDSLIRHDFLHYRSRDPISPAPQTLEEIGQVVAMPRQVGGDPPVYFAAVALFLRLTANWELDRQALLLRVLNTALLPLLTLCAYGATRELLNTPGNPGYPPELPLAVAALAALLPMLMMIGAAIGNDGLSNVVGAALCWAWLRSIGRGITLRRVMLILGLLVLGLLTKRSMLPYLLLLMPVGAIWLMRRQIRPASSIMPQQQSGRIYRIMINRAVRVAIAATLVVTLGYWLNNQANWGTAWGWYWLGSHEPATRVWPAHGHGSALQISPDNIAAYPLPPAAANRMHQQTLHFGARIWSAGVARGRLLVLNDEKRHEIKFQVNNSTILVDTSASVFEKTHHVVLGLQADSGTFYADDLWAQGGDLQLLANNSLDLPGIQPDSQLLDLFSYIRLPDVLWALTSGQLLQPLPNRWGALFFASFWGHFGWMNVPFVLDSGWMWALIGLCSISLAGLPLAVVRIPPGSARNQLWILLGLVAIGLLLPTLNAYSMPANQALQQGRYLFALFVPLALLLACGHCVLVPWRRYGWWLTGWLGFFGFFAVSALMYLVDYYHS